MTLLRWFALVFMLLLQIAPQAVSAQETSSTPEADLPSPHAAVQRDFEVSGLTLLGPTAIASIVFVYETPKEATTEFPRLHEFYRNEFEANQGGDLQPASTPKIGDERKAYAGSFMSEDQEAIVGLFAWREGSRVYVLVDIGLAGDLLTPLFDLGVSLSGRTLPNSAPAQATSPGEMGSGGAYELLPTLDDMPPGWVFTSDTDMLAALAASTPKP